MPDIEKIRARLRYAGMTDAEIDAEIRRTTENHLMNLINCREVDGDGQCVECRVSVGWIEHRESCRFHPSRTPKIWDWEEKDGR